MIRAAFAWFALVLLVRAIGICGYTVYEMGDHMIIRKKEKQ